MPLWLPFPGVGSPSSLLDVTGMADPSEVLFGVDARVIGQELRRRDDVVRLRGDVGAAVGEG
jgi:hypothetical protein